MSRIAVNKLANRLKTKEVNVDVVVDKLASKLLPSATAPATRTDGSALVVGDSYFDTVKQAVMELTAGGWTKTITSADVVDDLASTDATKVLSAKQGKTLFDLVNAVNATLIVYEYTATANQTVFSGVDNNGLTLNYIGANSLVFYNEGQLQKTVDFTPTSSSVLTLALGAEAGALVRVLAFGTFAVANVYTKPESDVQQSAMKQQWSGYLTGLNLVRNSTSSISLGTGAAYIESAGDILAVPTTITLSGLALTGSTWYHIYLYNNAGTPAIELVTTTPAAPFMGTARSKTGDTSRRYVGSVRTAASGSVFNFVHTGNRVSYREHQADTPFSILFGGAATTATAIDCAGPVPVTGTHLIAQFTDASAGGITRVANPDGGTVAATHNQLTLAFGTSVYAVMSLSAARTLAYVRTDAPSSSNFIIRATGYLFER